MKRRDEKKEICAACGKEFTQTDLGAWADIIMRKRSTCSRECSLIEQEREEKESNDGS